MQITPQQIEISKSHGGSNAMLELAAADQRTRAEVRGTLKQDRNYQVRFQVQCHSPAPAAQPA
jgi:hypothetical protein